MHRTLATNPNTPVLTLVISFRFMIWMGTTVLAMLVFCGGCDSKKKDETAYRTGDGKPRVTENGMKSGQTADMKDVARSESDDIKRRSSDTVDSSTQSLAMPVFLKWKAENGRDNALIHYEMAAALMPRKLSPAQRDLIEDVLEHGWSERAAPLVPLLATLQPMIGEIRKGAALDYARAIGWEMGLDTPIPNYRRVLEAARIVCAEGRNFESRGQYGKSLDNYMIVLTMGRDYATSGATLISALIWPQTQRISLDQIEHLLGGETLSRSLLNRLLFRLKEIESTQRSSSDLLRWESKLTWVFLEHCRKNPQRFLISLKEVGYATILSEEDLTDHLDNLEAQAKRFWDSQIEYLEMPYWAREDLHSYKEDLDVVVSAFRKPFDIRFPRALEVDVRCLRAKAHLLRTQIETALSLYKIDHNRYPRRLSDLVPAYFENLPIDPFSGEAFHYSPLPSGRGYQLYSVGPDRKDDGGQIRYVPEEGTISDGDLFPKKAK